MACSRSNAGRTIRIVATVSSVFMGPLVGSSYKGRHRARAERAWPIRWRGAEPSYSTMSSMTGIVRSVAAWYSAKF